MNSRTSTIGTWLVICLAMMVPSACGRSRTSEEPLQKGKQVIQRMSDTLAAAPAFSVTTREEREQVGANGKPRVVTLTRKTVVRRPDRLYFTTSGDVQNEAWYDGVGLTVAVHNDKVFAQSRMPETLDRTLDAITERYGISLPLADIVYSNPAHALIADTTTGGWVGRESVDGQPSDHLKFEDRGVNWEVWVAADGSPLPRRAVAEFPEQKRVRRFEITFSDWSLTPTIPPDRFDAHVPADYEGIALIQRAAVVRNIPDAPPAASEEKK